MDSKDFEAIAAVYGLGKVTEATGIPEGSINTNYRLETSRGRFFLRHTTVRSAEDLSFEASLLGHLAASRFPSPVIEATREGHPFMELKGGRATVFHYLPGEEYLRTQLSVDQFEHLGRELGKMH